MRRVFRRLFFSLLCTRLIERVSSQLGKWATTAFCVGGREVLKLSNHPGDTVLKQAGAPGSVLRVNYEVRGVEEQIKALNGFFPGIGDANREIIASPLPKGFDGYFAFPKWPNIARTYGDALRIVFDRIEEAVGDVFNYREHLDENWMRLEEKTGACIDALYGRHKSHNIIILPCQLGSRYVSKSVFNVLKEIREGDEFGLDPVNAGIGLLLHPQLFKAGSLSVDCPGAQCYHKRDKAWTCASFYSGVKNRDGKLDVEFGVSRVITSNPDFGSATAYFKR